MAEEAWAQASSFAELAEVTIRYLRGELVESPVSIHPVDGATRTIVDDLIALNRAGFLTIGSQAGPSGEGRDDGAYVEGFAPEAVARAIRSGCASDRIGVVLTAPGAVGGPGGYGASFPFAPGHPSPDWVSGAWGAAVDPRVLAELQGCWYVVAFDLRGRGDGGDPGLLWRSLRRAVASGGA